MTRVLAELLGAEQPSFRVVIQKLEQIAGKPSKDIRLTNEIAHITRDKIRALGLDPSDTTGQELYHALLVRFENDEKLARKTLSIDDNAGSIEVVQAVKKYLQTQAPKQEVFAIKNSVARQLFKKVPPKRTMKQLGYRSLDSMLKHESAAQVYVAAHLCESVTWKKKFIEQYSKLQPKDFEQRPLAVLLPNTTRWTKFIEQATDNQIQPQVFAVKELGSTVVLVRPNARVSILQTMSLLIESHNDITSATSYLKLQQVKPEFSAAVRNVADTEPMTNTELGDKPVPWRVVHQYYARFKDRYNPIIFEPHVRSADLRWLQPEVILENLHPAFEFWQDTKYAGYAHNKDMVSLNIFDIASDFHQKTLYPHRKIQALQRTLWQELMIRYLNHSNIEQGLSMEFASEPVLVSDIEDFQ